MAIKIKEGIVINDIVLRDTSNDATAIHWNINDEFVHMNEKLNPVADDWIMIEDSQDDDSKKKIKFSDVGNQTAQNIGSLGVGIYKSDSTNPKVFEFKKIVIGPLLPTGLSPLEIDSTDTEVVLTFVPTNLSIDDIGDGITYKKYLTEERSKLSGIEPLADVTTIARVETAEHSILVSSHQDISAPGQDIDDAVAKKHVQGTDTTLGVMTEAIDMGGFRIQNGEDPILDTDFVTKHYIDNNVTDIKAIHVDKTNEIYELGPIAIPGDDIVFVVERPDGNLPPEWFKRKLTLSQIYSHFDMTHVVHTNESNEFVTAEAVTVATASDLYLIEVYNSETEGFDKRRISWQIMSAGFESGLFHYQIFNEFATQLNVKNGPFDADDRLVIEDYNDGYTKKYINYGDLTNDATDPKAIHYDGVGEFDTIVHETTVATTDVFMIEKPMDDPTNPGEKRKITFGQIPTGHDAAAVHMEGVNEYAGVDRKSSSLDASYLLLEESEEETPSNRVKKRVRISDLPTGGGGQVNYGINKGGDTPIYDGKSGSGLLFRTIKLGTGFKDPGDGDALELTLDFNKIKDELNLHLKDVSNDGIFFTDDRKSSMLEHITWDLASVTSIATAAAAASIQVELDLLTTEVEGITAQLETMQADVDGLDVKITENGRSIDGLKERVSAIEDNMLIDVVSVNDNYTNTMKGIVYGKEGDYVKLKNISVYENFLQPQTLQITDGFLNERVEIKSINILRKVHQTPVTGLIPGQFFNILSETITDADGLYNCNISSIVPGWGMSYLWLNAGGFPYPPYQRVHMFNTFEPSSFSYQDIIFQLIDPPLNRTIPPIPGLPGPIIKSIGKWFQDDAQHVDWSRRVRIEDGGPVGAPYLQIVPLGYETVGVGDGNDNDSFSLVSDIEYDQINYKNIMKISNIVFPNQTSYDKSSSLFQSKNVDDSIEISFPFWLPRIDDPTFNEDLYSSERLGALVQSGNVPDYVLKMIKPIARRHYNQGYPHGGFRFMTSFSMVKYKIDAKSDNVPIEVSIPIFANFVSRKEYEGTYSTIVPIMNRTRIAGSSENIDPNSYIVASNRFENSSLPSSYVTDFIQGQAEGKKEEMILKGFGVVMALLISPDKRNDVMEGTPTSCLWGLLQESNRPDPEYYIGNMKFMNININNPYEPIGSIYIDTYDTTTPGDTIMVKIDPLQIKRLGSQVQSLDMGNNSIHNVVTPTQADLNNATTVEYIENALIPLRALSHEKDHDDGTDPLDEDLDLGGDEAQGEGVVIPHRVINMQDPDWSVLHHGVNMNSMINYVNQHGSGADPYAIHYNASNEINGNVALKSNPTELDIILIEDASDSFAKKKAYFSGGTSTPGYTIVNTTSSLSLTSGDYWKQYICDSSQNDIVITLPIIDSSTPGQSIVVTSRQASLTTSLKVESGFNNYINGGDIFIGLTFSCTLIHDGVDTWTLLSKNSWENQWLYARSFVSTHGDGGHAEGSLSMIFSDMPHQHHITISNLHHNQDIMYYLPDPGVQAATFVVSNSLNKVVFNSDSDISLTTPSASGTLTTEDYPGITTAIHSETPNEINNIPEKTTVEVDDILLIEDSSDNWNKKRIKTSSFMGDSPLKIVHFEVAVTGALYVLDEDVNTCFLIDLATFPYSLGYMPKITSENAGFRFYFKINAPLDNSVSIYMAGSGGDSINNHPFSYRVINTSITHCFMSDGVSNWIVLSSNGCVGTPFVADSSLGLQQFTDNASAKTGGLSVGELYRTVDVLKVVH